MQFPHDIIINRILANGTTSSQLLRLNSVVGSGGQGKVYDSTLYAGNNAIGRSLNLGIKSVNGGTDEKLINNVKKNANELRKAMELRECAGLMRIVFIIIPRAAYFNPQLIEERNRPYTFYHTAQSNMIYLGISLIRGKSLLSQINTSRDAGHYKYNPMQVFLNLVTAVKCMHEKNIVHLDLKPENVMIGETNSVYIIDFGSMCRIAECIMPPNAFTPQYSPGEVWNSQIEKEHGMHTHYVGHPNLYKRLDVFSIGCSLYEMLSLRKMFDTVGQSMGWNGKTNTVTSFLDIEADNPQFGWKQLIIDCINPDPRERPDVNDDFLTRIRALPEPDYALFTHIAPVASEEGAVTANEGAAGAIGGRRTKHRRQRRRRTQRRR